MHVDVDVLAARTEAELLERNAYFERFFTAEAPRLAAASQEMSRRFLAGGRLLAIGRGAAATDAQHVSVEFVHPVIVGKRALPALDLGAAVLPPGSRGREALAAIIQPLDMLLGFQYGSDDPEIGHILREARRRGAMTFGLSSADAEYTFDLPHADPFICQEIYEVLYHLLWETVHVFFEHREQGHDVGASSFLYPFLGKSEQTLDDALTQVRESMILKMREVNSLRAEVAQRESGVVCEVARAIGERLAAGGTILTFGNGGSATDANDFAIDCVQPPADCAPLPALSLSSEPASITAIVNDIGAEAIFSRQLIAHARPGDVALAISTSGNSPNILAALREARARGLLTVALAGYDGGKVLNDHLADYVMVVRSDYIPRIQEVQASLYHVLRRRLGDVWGGGADA